VGGALRDGQGQGGTQRSDVWGSGARSIGEKKKGRATEWGDLQSTQEAKKKTKGFENEAKRNPTTIRPNSTAAVLKGGESPSVVAGERGKKKHSTNERILSGETAERQAGRMLGEKVRRLTYHGAAEKKGGIV